MNKKGFTLIELLAVIVLIAIIGIITVPNVVEFNNASKNASYDFLIKNIRTAAESYFLECEFGSLVGCSIESDKLENIENKYTETDLATLANKGFLNVSDTNNAGEKIVLDPRNSNDISGCKFEITKVVDNNNGKVSYTLKGKSTNSSTCPQY